MSEKFVKVMYGTKSGASDFVYKINEVNIANDWNPTATTGRDFGGFNFSTEDKIIRWLHRGDTIYEVEIPEDAEIVDIVESATPHGVFRTNKIILKNPQKITDEMALEFYKKSTIPEFAYYKALAGVATMKYEKTALAILREKVNKENINEVLKEWNDFITHGNDPTWNRRNEIVDKIEEYLEEIKSDLLISINVSKEPYEKELSQDKIINLTGQSGSGKSYYAKQYKDNENYLIVDTDDIFSEKRFEKASGINKELGQMFRNKYSSLPRLEEDFDVIYTEIIEYCKKYNRTIIIDSAEFHLIKNINLLKGKIIILRTDIDTCYERCIERFKNKNPNYTEEELQKYSNKKLGIYSWYKGTNEFLRKIDKNERK